MSKSKTLRLDKTHQAGCPGCQDEGQRCGRWWNHDGCGLCKPQPIYTVDSDKVEVDIPGSPRLPFIITPAAATKLGVLGDGRGDNVTRDRWTHYPWVKAPLMDDVLGLEGVDLVLLGKERDRCPLKVYGLPDEVAP